MNKKYTFVSLVSLSMLAALYSQMSSADLRAQCLTGVPKFSGEAVRGDPNMLPVYIAADEAEINQPHSALYKGNADLKQGNRHLIADSVEVKQTSVPQSTALKRLAYVRGGFDYKDEQIQMRGQSADFDLDSKDGNIREAIIN